MSSASRSAAAIAATCVLTLAAAGGARAGGLASLCAEYETRSVAGIIENLLTEVEDCVRIAVAPPDSPRPLPRPVMLALGVPAFGLPQTDIVTAALGRRTLVGGGSSLIPTPARPGPGAFVVPPPDFIFGTPGGTPGGGQGTGRPEGPEVPGRPGSSGKPKGGSEPVPDWPPGGGKPPEENGAPKVPAVPLPAGIWLLSLGLAGLSAARLLQFRRSGTI